MEILNAAHIFETLSQETRLAAFRLLVKARKKGLTAGYMSKALDVPNNTMSFHLKHLSGAGIVTSTREGRSIIYTANFKQMHALIGFLVENCCSMENARVTESNDGETTIIHLNKCC